MPHAQPLLHPGSKNRQRSTLPGSYPGTARQLPATLVEQVDQGLRCHACQRGCLLHEGQVGFCRAIVNWEGTLHSTAYGVIAEASVTPIESKPVYHYRPGTRVLSLGGLGCNLRCPFCQNYEVAFKDASTGGGLTEPNLPPDRAIALALEQGCQGLAWTFNEPSISPVYTLDCMRLARAAGIYSVYVTNGLSTHRALDLIGPWLNVYRVDFKSVEPAFYRRLTGTQPVEHILDVARRAAADFGVHVEVVTNLMPGWNDGDERLRRLTEAIVAALGVNVPWHITTYVPYAFMRDVPPTPPKALAQAKELGQRAGLRFVYTDSLSSPQDAHTRCPTCQALLIERSGSAVAIVGLDQSGACSACGTAIGVVV